MKSIKKFFKNLRDKVAKQQRTLAEESIDTLYKNSPHLGKSPWAEGEYEINHKVSINGGGKTPHYPAMASGKNYEEAQKRAEAFYENIMSGPDPEGAFKALKEKTGLAPDQLADAMVSEGSSTFFLGPEKIKANQAECGDIVKISNSTAHAADVEDGGVHWQAKPNGYGTYRKTKRQIKAKHGNVLE